MPALDELAHLTEKEGEVECANVRAIHIRIGHDNDPVITEFIRVKFFLANTAAQRSDEISDFGRSQHFIEARLFNIQNLAL